MNNKKTLIWVVVLIVLLVGAIGYIAFDKLQDYREQNQINTFQQGAQYGYEQAGIMIFQQATSCQPFPITYNNQTINLIAVECIPQ
tara:strand:- start:295 stop:552 length:258 start_codon:yes stop_codon:yes gene_type:complete